MILSLYLSHLLKVGSKLTSEAKAIPPEETLRKNVLEKGPEMMEDLQEKHQACTQRSNRGHLGMA